MRYNVTKIASHEDGISVRVLDNKSRVSLWVDATLMHDEEEDTYYTTEWNKYIFYTWKSDDVREEKYQRSESGAGMLAFVEELLN